MRAETQEWARFVGLISVMIAAMGFMTYTLNARMGSFEHRVDRLEDNLEARMDGLEAKFDVLGEKFDVLENKLDQLVIALAGR